MMSNGPNQHECFLGTARRLRWDNCEAAFDMRLKGDYQAEARGKSQ